MASLRVEYLGERADVELIGVGAGRGADPEPVAAADGQVRGQLGEDRFADPASCGTAPAGRAQASAEAPGVAAVVAGVGPAQSGDPGQGLVADRGEALLPPELIGVVRSR